MFTHRLVLIALPQIYLCLMATAPLPETPLDLKSTLDHTLAVVRTAAAELARLSHTELEVEHKGDGSPVTNADLASHQILADGLAPLGIPVVSEEGGRTPHAERQTWSRMWLVDPLDGTGSFIRMHSGYARRPRPHSAARAGGVP